jgi:hypothetical protein
MNIQMPMQPEELTAAFVSKLVHELRPGVTVETVDIENVRSYGEADNANSVSTSTQVKFNVRYGKGAPSSLTKRFLAKMSIPADVECSNPVLDALFENEIAFYSRLRQELDIETPLGLGGRFDPANKCFVLLMEDLTPRAPHINSMMDNDNVAIAEGVLDTFARLHAHLWESPRFKTDLSWIQNQVEGSIETLFDGSVRDHVVNELETEKFKREFAQELGMTEAEMYAGEKALKRHQAKFPQTFLHGDAHFANTYVLPDGTGGLFDWQVCCRGFLMHDIGYFIQTALSVETRRKHERELLAFYRDRLCTYGVKNAPDLEILWLEYRRSALHGFYLGWLTAPRKNYGLEVIVIGNHRTKTACQDFGTKKLISEIV